jgi:tRNA dimethylallyltransferase
VGVLAAESVEGEIVSADSMQVYRGMNIGTAKAAADRQARVPHHLVDIIDPDQPFSVADYRERADAALADIWRRGRQPLVVGGSGLYVRAVLEEMDFSRVPADPEVRSRLRAEARALGLRRLHERLAAVDREAADRIHPNDEKRIIRALEVYAKTGRPISTFQTVDQQRAPRYNTRQFGLTLPRDVLYRRIDARVDRMMAEGLAEEVRRLLDQGYGDRLVAMKGLGYAQLAPYVRGEIGLDEAERRLKRDTRRLAKRQLTWFRADPSIEWLDVEEVGGSTVAAERIVARWNEE